MGLLQMVLYTVDKETALKELVNEPLDLAVETLVKVAPIKDAYDTHKVVYRIEVASGDAAARFAQGATQSVTAGGDKVADVTVTRLKPTDARGDDTAGPDFLKSTQYLECEDPEVRAHADKAGGDLKDPVEIALAMEKYVHTEMKDKNFATGLATASEVARKMEGDCTEHAVLLAAMLRAKEVPSRVAIGMVYADKLSAFAGHMWTEALLNGVWVPLDATLGRGGIGAAHIKVSDSSLAENAPTPVTAFLPMVHLLGQMKIEVVASE
jgi:transglutaminase-like putative cysteine protease